MYRLAAHSTIRNHTERGRLAVRPGDVVGKDTERDHLPAAQREEQRRGASWIDMMKEKIAPTRIPFHTSAP